MPYKQRFGKHNASPLSYGMSSSRYKPKGGYGVGSSKPKETPITPKVNTGIDAETDVISQNNNIANLELASVPKKRGFLDWAQDGLTAAGMIPGFGAIPDLINTVVSGGRAAHAAATGDKKALKEHLGYAALNLAAAVPVAGQAAGATKLAMSANKIQKAVKKVVPDLAEVSIKAGKTQKYGVKGIKGVKSGNDEIEIAQQEKHKQKVGDMLRDSDYAGDGGDVEKNKNLV